MKLWIVVCRYDCEGDQSEQLRYYEYDSGADCEAWPVVQEREPTKEEAFALAPSWRPAFAPERGDSFSVFGPFDVSVCARCV